MRMRRVLWTVYLLLLAIATYAGVIVTERPPVHVLTVESTQAQIGKYDTHAECVAAAKDAGPGDYVCREIVRLSVVGHCDDVPKPEMPAQEYLVAAECPTNDNRYMSMVPGWVSAPYPTCWTPGDEPVEPEAVACAAVEPNNWVVPPEEAGETPPCIPGCGEDFTLTEPQPVPTSLN